MRVSYVIVKKKQGSKAILYWPNPPPAYCLQK